MRALEINADIILKATKVNGVYDKDPNKFKDAKMFKSLKYMQVLEKELEIMDSTAFSLCMENQLPILVFSMREPGSIYRAVMGEEIGTLVD